MNKRLALSWSGGKDGCMALHTLVQQGYTIACLVTTVPAEMGRTFGHGDRTEMIQLQAEALNIPVHFIECTFKSYTDRFVESLSKLKEEYQLTGIAFGDLYMDEHRDWGESVAKRAGVDAIYPLWMKQDESEVALKKFVESGYEAVVIRVREELVDEAWLGRKVDSSFYHDIIKMNICPMGEAGEYHTYVFNGPLFKKKIKLGEPSIVEYESSKKVEFDSFILTNS
ncbi:diphthine--ammonia ligase [Cytobacillus sp. FJAT-54145]|uniref:Diphthine--ammonia ligase n=1 Tax=Cytobacillus spartinae TaxID=3299023 RepID=A0ABW6K4Z4_9BACI